MNRWFRKTITSLYNTVAAPVAATRVALADRLQNVRETASLLYHRVRARLGYVEQETLKEVVEEQAEQEHPESQEQQDEDVDLTPVEHELAMNMAYRSFRSSGLPKADVNTYIEKVKPHIKTLIEEQLRELKSTKVQLHMWVRWKKPVEGLAFELSEEEMRGAQDLPGAKADQFIRVEKVFNSKMTEIFEASDIDEILVAMFAFIKAQVEHPALPKSGFTLDHIMHLDVDFHKLVLTRGSSFIPLPAWIAAKKAVINPKNIDEECFKWAVIAALHGEDIKAHPERIANLLPYEDRYNWGGLKFPMALNKIGKFEKNNPEIAVNVLFTSEKRIYIGRRSEFNSKRKIKANLLMVVDGENRHYTAVKNLSRLLSSMNAKHKGAYHFCLNCLNGFRTKVGRDKHYEYCSSNGEVKIKMPTEKDKWLKYHQGQNQFKVPFMLYADFESILKPVNRDKMKTPKGASYTEKVNTHVPSGWCVHSKFAYGEVQDPLKVYRGEDCVEKFIEYIESEVKRLYAAYPQQPMTELTDVLQREHNEAAQCHICFKPFDDPQNNRKVRDHCHYTGLYRGAAHNSCNLKYRIPDHIPIVFHNLSGYDAHLFIRELGKQFNKEDIGCIAENKEKYISFNVKIHAKLAGVTDRNGEEVHKKISLRFIDSCRFMASSLDKLASNLSDDQCKNLREFYKEEGVFKLMRRKGVYPYEYMDGWDRFSETKLPAKEAFYSKLNLKGISDRDYEHAEQVWSKITPEDEDKGVTLGDYHDVYLATDVLLLADVFETFRDTCLKHYKLDPAHFYTAPGLAWQAALKYTGQTLELLTDIDKLLMFEKGIRGGITQAVLRYAKANNKYMGDLYNPEELSSYLQYLDANNLYGWAMIQKLPTGKFNWVADLEQFTSKKIAELVKKDKIQRHGYILEVDIDYPKELHRGHNELPFLPERMKIGKVEKLVPNLSKKKKYVIHIRALDQALKHGLVLKKVHRVIQFEQSAWLKPYIDFNTRLRTAASNDFEKDFFKLMNNSVFGKTMENIRNHRDMKLVTSEQKYQKYVMKPNFKDSVKFSDNLMGVEMGKTEITMNKPLYLGQAILDLSKIVMYEFHYDYMIPKYGSKVKLCYMDTDSFVY